MNPARNRTLGIDLVHKRISQARELKKRLISVTSKLESDYEKGVISYWEYQNSLNKQLNGKTEQYWLNYYNSYIENLENKLPKERFTNNRLLIFSIFVIMGIGILIFNNYTSFTVKVSDGETIIDNILFSTLDKQIYVPEIILEQSGASENQINLATFTAYKYLKVRNPPSLDKIKEIEIEFRVEKSWLGSNKLSEEKIVLYEYSNNKWSPAFTELKNEDEEHYFYASRVSSINEFAIGFESEETVKVIRLRPKTIQKIGVYPFIVENKEIIFYGIIPLSIMFSLLILILRFTIKKLSRSSKKQKEAINE